MTKFFAALIIMLGFMAITGPARAGVVTGDFVCTEDVTVTNVSDNGGVVTGDLVIDNGGVVTGDFIPCDNGTTLTNITGDGSGYIGVVTGD